MRNRTIVASMLCVAGSLVLQSAAAAQGWNWERMPGAATQVAIGGGAVWCIGTDAAAGGRKIYRWRQGSWEPYPGGAVRIAVDSRGLPWVVNAQRQIWRLTGAGPNGQWQLLPGSATDIAAGGGAVWVVGTTAVGGGYNIWRWNGSNWTGVQGGAVRIAVDGSGVPWVVNSTHQIWKFQPAFGTWRLLPGAATRIGANAGVWVTGIGRAPGGFEIWRWNGSGWDKYARNGAVSIAVGPSGRLWVTNNAHEIYRIDI
jgi:hypothetical protein